jgi:hypothetical protein
MWFWKRNPTTAETPTPARAAAVNELDLAFVIDTTGSMGSFIHAAQQRVGELIQAARGAADVSLRVGFVEYRDHPPQDRLVYRVYAMSDDPKDAQSALASLRADGGGDGPEAVLDGVLAACTELAWRPHARRIAVLIGDSPPHGCGGPGDYFRDGCPCGQTIESVTAAAENARVTLYALGLTRSVTDSFSRLARFTGGEYFDTGHGGAAVTKLQDVLLTEFGQLELDAKVVEAWNGLDDASIDAVAEQLELASGPVGASVARLSGRGLLKLATSFVAAGAD